METICWRTIDVNAGQRATADIAVPAETPVELFVNGRLLAVFHCTPSALEDLATGYLLGQGLVASPRDIITCDADYDSLIISLKLVRPLNEERAGRMERTVILSGCVQGPGQRLAPATDILNEPVSPAAAATIKFDPQAVSVSLATLLKSGVIYRRTRGIHSAAVCSRSGRIMVISEDIGRHNALDKVLGWTARHNADPSKLYVVASGRISSEAVAKMIRFGIPLMATRGVPTSLALEIAQNKGITLAGSLGPGKLRIYTHNERLL